MKVDLIRKYRWYIVGLIMSVIMISVSLSFCLWDDNSLKSLKASGGSGDYNEYIVVPGKQYKIAVDKYKDDNLTEGKNGIANVGDIVTFGKYYQDAGGSTKTDLRWIVVDIRDNSGNKELYLLAESVVAFGSFWDDEAYYNSGNTWSNSGHYNQNYKTSTIREWLNSEKRTDGNLVGFKNGDNRKVFNGFLDEAFNDIEQTAIIPRNLGSMKGYYGDVSNPGGSLGGANNSYGNIPDQKVWIPSWTEIYGRIPYGSTVNDAIDDTIFSYFNPVVTGYPADSKKVGRTTPFASTASLSNYTNVAATGAGDSQSVGAGSVSPVWWWLRSPYPGDNFNALMVYPDGQGSSHSTSDSSGGVRPAVCLAR